MPFEQPTYKTYKISLNEFKLDKVPRRNSECNVIVEDVIDDSRSMDSINKGITPKDNNEPNWEKQREKYDRREHIDRHIPKSKK
jgi:hypothetical protein